MKRLLIYTLLCLVGVLFPKSMKAQCTITSSGNVYTVNAVKAGDLQSYINGLSTEAKATLATNLTGKTIKFVGKFNASDLTALRDAGCCTSSTVDMGDAKFMRYVSTPSNDMLFTSETSGTPADYTRGFVGGTLYQATVTATRSWDASSEAAYTGDTIYVNDDAKNAAMWSAVVGSHAKVPATFHYYMMTVTKDWSSVADPGAVQFRDYDANTYSESNKPSVDSYGVGEYIRFPQSGATYRYYKMVDRSWVSTEASESAVEPLFAESDRDNHKNDYSNDAVIKFASAYNYYQVVETRTWSGPTDTPNSSSTWTNENPDFAEADIESHKDAEHLQSVRFPATYNYYVLSETVSRSWGDPIAYSDGDNTKHISYHFSTVAEMNANTTAANGEYAIVGGTEKVYHDGWKDSYEEYDYDQMRFSYWGTNLIHAVTSQYADENINGEIFSGCDNVQTVDFKAGKVTGLTSKSNLQTLNVGKKVSTIESAALRESSVQTVTFDKDYEPGETPVNLTIKDYAFQQCAQLSSIEFPNRVVDIQHDAFKEAGTSAEELSVSFERRSTTNGASVNYDVDLVIGSSAFYGCTTLKTLELPIRLTTLGSDAFKLSGLETMVIREDVEDSRLTTIPSGAFQKSALTTVKIPRSVTLIELDAFGSCYELTDIEFQESNQTPQPPLTIKSGAFAGGDESKYKLRSVVVDFTHETRMTYCEYNAFNFTSLMGQTASGSQAAILTFPESDWDFYAGDWKKGLAFTQANLNAFKDGYSGTRAEKQPNAENAGKVPDCLPANGWQQFANTSTGIEVLIPDGAEYIRSYSTTKSYKIPLIAGTSTKLVRVFRVTGFSDGWEPGDDPYDRSKANEANRVATVTEVTDYIPANTGLILVGNGTDNQSYMMFKNEVDETEVTVTKYPYQQDLSNTATANLLEPVGDAPIILNPTTPYPIGEINPTTADKYRNFGFKPSTKKFLRSQPGVTLKANLAYLKLPVCLFRWANETGGTESDGYSSSANITLILDLDEEVTAVETIHDRNEGKSATSEYYYTLQGVKVERPTVKGIYIKDGRKVLIK